MKKYSNKHLVTKSYFVVVIFILLITQNAFAQIERVSNPQNINVNQTYSYSNSNYFQSGYFHTPNPQSFVFIKGDDALPTDYWYRYTVKVNVQPMVPSNGEFVASGAITQTDLVIEYNPFSNSANFNDLSRYQLGNRHGVQVTVTETILENLTTPGIPVVNGTPPSGVKLYLGFTVENEGVPLATTPPQFNNTTITNQINIGWNPVVGAKSYELEWTWLDRYSSNFNTLLNADRVPLSVRDFELNSTRIQTEETYYEIPKVYDYGFLIYRVRAVGVFEDDVMTPYHGPWTFDDRTASNVDDWPNYTAISAHENNKNWQFQASYAEEGKKKEVVSYFDGTLRNRQTVTRINSDENAIIGEVIYDNQGRPAIEVLPVPTTGDEIKYYQDFNRSSQTGDTYNHIDFDWDIPTAADEDCEVNVSGMSTVQGASKYYGVEGPTDSEKPFQKYVPDAQEFPFSQIEYTPDNTGRIRRKSGVGPDHKLGSDHEMKYYYITPTQEELNRLFGYRVGNASHYKKNMVVDPNGQVSISYIDPQGRTIATALAGESSPSSGLENLEGIETAEGVVTDLLNKLVATDTDTNIDANERYSTGTFGNLNDGLRVSKEIGVSKNGTVYRFEYNAQNHDFEVACKASTNTYDFKYDLSLTVTDDCGNVVIFDSEETVNEFVENLIRDGEAALDIGNYTVYKNLKVNEEALLNYADDYIADLQDKTNDCYVAPFSLNLPDTCEIDCATCITDLGDKLSYISYNLSLFYDVDIPVSNIQDNNGDITVTGVQIDNVDTIEINSYANGYATEWQITLEACQSACGIQVIANCEVYELLLLQDVSPGGQYGFIDPIVDENQPVTATDSLSVFNDALLDEVGNRIRQGTNNYTNNDWRHPLTAYENSNGSEARIIVEQLTDDGDSSLADEIFNPAKMDDVTPVTGYTEDGAPYLYILPEQLLHLEDFLAAWDNNWAHSLLGYHPEYQYLEYERSICNLTESITVVYEENGDDISTTFDSRAYDDYLRQIETYTHAQQAGLLTSNLSIINSDPYFSNSLPLGLSSVHDDIIEDALDDYEGAGKSLAKIAYELAVCNGLTSCQAPSNFTINNLPSANLTLEQKNRIWQHYKNNYLSVKAKIQYVLLNDYTASLGYYNGCLLGQNSDGTGGVAPRGLNSVINDQTLGNYNTGITINGANQLCDTGDASLYATKEKRFIPLDFNIDDTNANSSSTALANELSENADAIIYAQTGQCPLLHDLEYFLNGFVQQDNITDLEGSNTYQGQYLAPDLYSAFGGVTNVPAISFTGTINGDAMEFTMTPSGCSNPFTLILPDGTNWDQSTYGWDDYGATWNILSLSTLFYEGFTSGTHNFSVLAQIQIANGSQIDAVFTGTTCVNIGSCASLANDINSTIIGASGYQIIPECTLEEDISGDLANVLNELIDNNTIFSTTPYELETVISYSTGFLPVLYSDDLANIGGTWTYEAGSYILRVPSSIGIGGSDPIMVPRLSMQVSALQGVINSSTFDGITSVQFITDDDYATQATIHYLRTDGTSGSVQATFTEEFDFACCERPVDGGDVDDEEPPGGDEYEYQDWCHYNGEGYHVQEVNFQTTFRGMLNYALNNGTGNNIYTTLPNSIVNVPQPSERFFWKENFEGICEALCYGDYSYPYDTAPDARMSLNSAQTQAGDPPGTVLLTFGGVLNNGVVKLRTGIENFSEIASFNHFDVDANEVTLVYTKTNGDVIILDNLEFNMYGGCDVSTNFEVFQDTGADFCSFTLPPASTCDTGGGGGGQNRSPFNITITPTGPMSDRGDMPRCEPCIAQPLAPISCSSGYQAYLDFMNFQIPLDTSEPVSQTISGVTLTDFYEEQFCNLNLQYLVAPYIYYIQTFGITSTQDENYLTLAAFGDTGLRYGYNGINDVIDAFATYYNTFGNNPDVYSWKDYVNNIYLKQHIVCPPAKLYSIYTVPLVDDCVDFLAGIAETYEAEAYQELLNQYREAFITNYIDEAMGDVVENLDMTYTDEEHQYTLYYYDQAGNLAQTVPPQGVNRFPIENEGFNDQIDAFRDSSGPNATNQESSTYLPDHNLETQYRYNSLNQLVWQQTPDGGITRFAYDDLGRIIASQNAWQRLEVSTPTIIQEVSGSYAISSGGTQIDKLTTSWDGAYSQEFMEGDGYVEYKTYEAGSNSNLAVALGLGIENSSLNALPHADIDYSFYTFGTNSLRVYANGNHIAGAPVVYTPGDILRIKRQNGVIYYYINEDVVATYNETQPSQRLHMRTTMRYTVSKAKEIKIEGFTSDTEAERFSYTTYDGIGRITEAGEITPQTSQYRITDQGRLERKYLNDQFSRVNSFLLNDGIREEITQTVYDKPVSLAAFPGAPTSINESTDLFEGAIAPVSQHNRVTGVLYYDRLPVLQHSGGPQFTNAIFYNYDIHGNVKELINFYPDLYLEGSNRHVKSINYEYDLISGNVQEVIYQKGHQDQFIHKYEYDADNRITDVHTSRDGFVWERDASYKYYDHGPMARMEIGNKQVQGSDYVYTLQGWLKSVNGEYIEDPNNDFGKDGTSNSMVARDAFGYSLGYYNGDYSPVGTVTGDPFSLSNPATNTLYNGNINQMVTSIRQSENQMLPASVSNYTYDQLNRIKSMQSQLVVGNNTSITAGHESNYSFDRNGNLLTLSRKAVQNGVQQEMDNFTYHYKDNTNQLTLVNDAVNASLFQEDLDDQEAQIGIAYDASNADSHNYVYDEIGQLIEDKTEKLKIFWRVDGKVEKVEKYENGFDQAVTQTTIFTYDGLGNRITKTIVPDEGDIVTTRYARDAQGNVLSVFETVANDEEYENDTFTTITNKEYHIYGSSRLGIEQSNVDITSQDFLGLTDNSDIVLELGNNRSTQWQANNTAFDEGKFGVVNFDQLLDFGLKEAIADNDSIQIGSISFSRIDRAGTVQKNTLETYFKNVNNRYFPVYIVTSETAGGTKDTKYITTSISFSEADVLEVSSLNKFDTDFIPDTDSKNTNDVTLQINNLKLTLSNGLLVMTEYSEPAASVIEQVPTSTLGGTYNTSFQLRQFRYKATTEQNTLVNTFDLPNQSLASTLRGAPSMTAIANDPIWVPSLFTNANVYYDYANTVGDKRYELSNHLGNVLSVVTDKKIPTFTNSSLNYFNADVVTYNDYYPFGMIVPQRHANTSDYRYGFNGMELDNEIKGEGNSYTTPFRQYDPRVGRWLSLDPLMAKYAGQSPYAGFNNNPIYFADPTGLEGDPPKTIRNKEGKVVDPNGNPSDFADDWFAAVEGNLVMTNGTDYQVWNPATGKYDIGRKPKNHRGSSRRSYEYIPEDLQIGDTYEQYLYDPYGVLFTAANDSRTLQYVGELNWVILDEFESAKTRKFAAGFLPIGYGGSRLSAWISKTYAGRQMVTMSNRFVIGADYAIKKTLEWARPIKGYTDVAIHGSSNSFWIKVSGEWKAVTHRTLAKMIKDREITGKIRLLSCNCGSLPNGPAQNLANKLNVDVMAPTETLQTYENGIQIISNIERSPISTGKWEIFSPRNK